MLLRKNKKVEWTGECQQAFSQLKRLCTDTPILAFADYSEPFKVHTGASGLGLGDVLYQTQEYGLESHKLCKQNSQ